MKDCSSSSCNDSGTEGLESGLKSLINAQLLLGKEVLKLLGGAGRSAADMAAGIRLPRGGGCCEVPEPCWMPRSLGEVGCKLRPGDTGTVCLVVTNGDFRSHSYQFAATGASAAHVSFSTSAVTLGPKERIAVTARFTVPRESKDGEDCRCIDHEALIWVRGCRNHYLRWRIDEVAASQACCHEVAVDDNPDYVLHWYDHFYLPRACPGGAVGTQGGTGVVGVVR